MNLKTTSISIALFALSTSVLCEPSRWALVANQEEVKVYVDTETLRRAGPKVRAWTMWIFKEPKETQSTTPKKTYSVEKELSAYDCDERVVASYNWHRLADVDATNVVESFHIDQTKAPERPLIPDTIGEGVLKFVCKFTEPEYGEPKVPTSAAKPKTQAQRTRADRSAPAASR